MKILCFVKKGHITLDDEIKITCSNRKIIDFEYLNRVQISTKNNRIMTKLIFNKIYIRFIICHIES